VFCDTPRRLLAWTLYCFFPLFLFFVTKASLLQAVGQHRQACNHPRRNSCKLDLKCHQQQCTACTVSKNKAHYSYLFLTDS
jgi:hypothetical protein